MELSVHSDHDQSEQPSSLLLLGKLLLARGPVIRCGEIRNRGPRCFRNVSAHDIRGKFRQLAEMGYGRHYNILFIKAPPEQLSDEKLLAVSIHRTPYTEAYHRPLTEDVAKCVMRLLRFHQVDSLDQLDDLLLLV